MNFSISPKLQIAIKVLPFAFIAHNTEETLGMEKWSKEIPFYFHESVTTAQFAIAVILLSILALGIIFGKRWYASKKLYMHVISGFSGLLFLNVFFPHVLLTFVLSKYSPGVYSAILMILPLTIYILTHLYRAGIISFRRIVINSLIGSAIGIPLVFAFLKIGELLT